VPRAVVYIFGVIGIERRTAAPTMLAAVATLLAATALASGCGSGEETASTKSASAAPPAGIEGEVSGGGAGQPRTAQSPRSVQDGGRADDGTLKGQGGGASSGGGANRAAPTAADRRAAQACPAGYTEQQCRATVEAIAKPTPSHSVEDASDCVKAMGKETCEEVAKGLHADEGQDGGSVNAEECVRNPTPHCEEALRAVAESLAAARAGE
jgi:hypothetical protein